MTNIERVNEITAELKSFSKNRYCREEILPELFALQDEMVNLTFNGDHSENAQLKIWDVKRHFQNLNEESGYIAEDAFKKFEFGCDDFGNLIRSEISGRRGEEKAFRCLKTLRSQNKILTNIELEHEDLRCEIDAIVITRKAIFIIEVKNTGKDIIIDEKGNYYRLSQYQSLDKNIGERMNEKVYLLKKVLEDSGIKNINIETYLLFTNSSIQVDNQYPYLKECYLSNLCHLIDKYSGSIIYSDSDLNKIFEIVSDVKCRGTYPISMDINQFKLDFATVMAALESASEERNEYDFVAGEHRYVPFKRFFGVPPYDVTEDIPDEENFDYHVPNCFDKLRSNPVVKKGAIALGVAGLAAVAACKLIKK